MRKRWLLTALVAALLCATTAQAVPDTPYDPELMLWYPALTQTQQALFDLCYAAAAQGQETVELPKDSGYADVCAAMDALMRDCPELSWLSRYYSVQYYQQKPETATRVTLRFNAEPGETAHLTAAMSMAAGAQSANPWETALSLHDALCEAVVYQDGTRAYDAYGALAQGRAVCDGYASAYALACRMAGIRCGVVTGTAADSEGEVSNHAWNLVDFGTSAMLVDVTWDDQDALGRILYGYFGLTDDWAAADHQEEPFLERPVCQDVELNWHVRKGLALGALPDTELRAWWENQLICLRDGERATVEARFLDQATFVRFTENWNSWMEDFNQRMGAQGLYGRWSYMTLETPQIFSLTLVQE